MEKLNRAELGPIQPSLSVLLLCVILTFVSEPDFLPSGDLSGICVGPDCPWHWLWWCGLSVLWLSQMCSQVYPDYKRVEKSYVWQCLEGVQRVVTYGGNHPHLVPPVRTVGWDTYDYLDTDRSLDVLPIYGLNHSDTQRNLQRGRREDL